MSIHCCRKSIGYKTKEIAKLPRPVGAETELVDVACEERRCERLIVSC